MDDIDKFTKDNLILKFRLYRSTFYNLYSITKNLSKTKGEYIITLSQYNQKIINIKKCPKENPYYKAIMFLSDIAKNLDENSCLYDILMQYNSGISNDIILNIEKGNKNRKNFTKYELSMLTKDEVINHLLELLPDFIIRYTFDDDVYAFYSTWNDLIFVNEKKTFNRNEITINYCLKGFCLPLVTLLIHECWGHKKVFLSCEGRNSPTRNFLRNENFQENIIEIPLKNNKIKGESGCEIEYLLTGQRNYSNVFSKYLLSIVFSNEELLDVTLWVKPSFQRLRN